MPLKYVEEEQIALLGKMLIHSTGHLTAREKELFDLLVETLNQKVERRHRLEQRTGLLRSRSGEEVDPRTPTDVEEQQYRAKMQALRNLPPDEVIRKFIECWNIPDFEMEFACLSAKFSKGLRPDESMSEYTNRRLQRYNDRKGTSCERKRLDHARVLKAEGGQALVEAMEVYEGSSDETLFHRNYQLVLEDGSWKVADFFNISQNKRLLRSRRERPPAANRPSGRPRH
jgi:hypothetical protein